MAANRARLAVFALAILLPVSVAASFGGTPCRADFLCHFVAWGVVIAVAAGIPLASLTFAVLHVVFCHPARSRGLQAVAGAVIGLLAYETGAVVASYLGTLGKDPMTGLLAVCAVAAIASVLYARSAPRTS